MEDVGLETLPLEKFSAGVYGCESMQLMSESCVL